MLKPWDVLQNERGSILILSLLLMAVLTLIGISANNTTTTELKIASNDRLYRNSFNAAESGLAYVIQFEPSLYGDDNIDPDTSVFANNVTVGDLNFDAKVTYDGANVRGKSLRGSGFSAGVFRAHDYLIEIAGNGIDRLRARGYRIGF